MSARWPLACFVAMGLFWGTWAALLPDIRSQVGATDAELGLALLGTGCGALPAMIVTGRLWRRLGWWLMPLTAAAFGASVLAPIIVATPLALAVALVFIGASSGALDVAMNSGVSDVEVARSRRLMYGAHALFSLAVLIGSVATGALRELGGGPLHALPAVAAIFALVVVGSATAARRAGVAARAEPAYDALQTVSRRLPLMALITLAVLCALAFLIEDAVQHWSALHLERELGANPLIGGAAPGIFAGAMFLGRSAGQWLGGRFSDRALLTGGGLAAAFGLAIVALAPSQLVALSGLVAGGAGVALVAPALFARAGRLADARGRGAAIATLTVFGYTGFLVGPVVMGLVSDVAGLRVAIGVLAIFALVLAGSGAFVLGARRAGRYEEGEELLRTGRA